MTATGKKHSEHVTSYPPAPIPLRQFEVMQIYRCGPINGKADERAGLRMADDMNSGSDVNRINTDALTAQLR